MADWESVDSRAPQGEAQQGGPQEQAMAAVEVLKKNLPLVIGIVVVLALAYVYLFVLPKPGMLTITVRELDANKMFSDAEVTVVESSSGRQVATPLLEDGKATVQVPSGSLRVDVAPQKAGYSEVSKDVTVPSGGSASATVDVPRTADLSFKGTATGIAMGAGCSKTVTLTVENNGDSAFDAELVAEPSDFARMFTYGGPQAIEAKSDADFKVTVTAPSTKGTVEGTIRVKYTATSVDFSAEAGDAPEMSLDRSDIQIICRESACDDVAVSVRNNGRSDLTDLGYSLGGGITDADIEVIGFENKPIKPDKKTTFFVRGRPSAVGKVGKLIITSGCGEEELPVQIK